MAHYAVLDENNIVINVITGRDEDEVVGGISDWEAHYGEFFGKTVKRTSYNTFANVHRDNGVAFRKNYAMVGGSYSPELDAFISIKPFPSWLLDEETCTWYAPVPEPAREGLLLWIWDESVLGWKEHLPE
jgi:hypothetical protein